MNELKWKCWQDYWMKTSSKKNPTNVTKQVNSFPTVWPVLVTLYEVLWMRVKSLTCTLHSLSLSPHWHVITIWNLTAVCLDPLPSFIEQGQILLEWVIGKKRKPCRSVPILWTIMHLILINHPGKPHIICITHELLQRLILPLIFHPGPTAQTGKRAGFVSRYWSKVSFSNSTMQRASRGLLIWFSEYKEGTRVDIQYVNWTADLCLRARPKSLLSIVG